MHNVFAYLGEQRRKRGEREVRGEEREKKNNACTHTIVQAVPPPDTP